jgi:hypothetical protein
VVAKVRERLAVNTRVKLELCHVVLCCVESLQIRKKVETVSKEENNKGRMDTSCDR